MLCMGRKFQQALACYLMCIYYNIAGQYVFVLHMRSPNLFIDVSDCFESMKNFVLPPEFFAQTTYEFQINAFVRNFTCERYYINYYIQIHIRENKENEEQLLKNIKSSVMSEVDSLNTLVEFLKKHQINRSDLSIRSTVACPEEKVVINDYRTTWSTTLIGHSTLAEELCIGNNGKAIERKCLGDFNTGAFWSSIQGECANVSSILTIHLHELSKIKITKNNILNTSLELKSLETSRNNLSFADVQFVAQILRNMADVPDIEPEVFRPVISTVDNVIGIEHLRFKHGNSHSNVSDRILFAVKNTLSNLETHGRVFEAAGSNIAVLVFPYRDNTTQAGVILESWNSSLTKLFNATEKEDLYSSFDKFEAGILLPKNMNSSSCTEENLAIMIYKNFHQVEKFEVISPIIDISMGSQHVCDEYSPIEIFFKVSQMEPNTSYECAVWDPTLNYNFGGWSNKGCITHLVDSTHMLCSCDHLASYTVISELRPSFMKFQINFSRVVLYTGWITSACGLLIIVLTFILFREYRKNLKHKVLFNLSLSLFMYMVIISAGLEQKNWTAFPCTLVAIVLHYFMLSSFSWMLVEAFIQYHCLVKIIGTYIPRFMQKASLFAWGVPLIIVGITLSFDYKIYISKNKFCWARVRLKDRVFYYGVAGPAVTMTAMTLVIFVLILRSTCRNTQKSLRTNQNERKLKIARVRAILCVAVLLSIAWIYGMINVYANYFAIQYLYSVTLTLLGIFIFIYFLFVNKETRKLWRSLFYGRSNITKTPAISRIDVSMSTDVSITSSSSRRGK